MKFVLKPENTMAFQRLARGDLFKSNNKFYMKTEDIMDPDGHIYNCVNISDGTIQRFTLEAPVIPVNYDLVIK